MTFDDIPSMVEQIAVDKDWRDSYFYIPGYYQQLDKTMIIDTHESDKSIDIIRSCGEI